jgi:co-chaperonin GroES (HSP10)
MQIKPVNARTLVRPLRREDVKVGSLILPGGGMGTLKESVVVNDFVIVDAAGVTTLVKAGEKVIYPEGNGMGHVIDGVPHDWVVITDIWGIIDGGIPETAIPETTGGIPETAIP